MHRHSPAPGLPIILLLWVLAPAARADPGVPALDPARVGWTRLVYNASKFGISSSSEITLKQVGTAETRSALIVPPRGEGLEPHREHNLLLRIDNRTLGRDSHLDLWLDPIDATAYQRSQIEAGKKHPRYKVYRFTRDGAFSRRLIPEKGEEDLPRERWSNVVEEYDRFDPTRGGAVTEPAALFYVAAAAALEKPGDRIELRVFSDHQVWPVEIVVETSETVETDHVIRTTEGEHRARGPLETLRLLVHPRPASDARSKDFKFLSIGGDITLHLDPRSRAPVVISGKAPYAGKLKILLEELELAPPSPTP